MSGLDIQLENVRYDKSCTVFGVDWYEPVENWLRQVAVSCRVLKSLCNPSALLRGTKPVSALSRAFVLRWHAHFCNFLFLDIVSGNTHVSEPHWPMLLQQRFLDFCLSLRDYDSFRLALSCLSLAGYFKYGLAVESETREIPSTLQVCLFFSNLFLKFCFLTLFFLQSYFFKACWSIWHFENSSKLCFSAE